jgi:hypothetical protein
MGLITKEAEENQNIAKPRILHKTVKTRGFNDIRLIFRNGCEGG